MACVCGHAIEEHEDGIGACEGEIGIGRTFTPCECLGYEEDEEEES